MLARGSATSSWLAHTSLSLSQMPPKKEEAEKPPGPYDGRTKPYPTEADPKIMKERREDKYGKYTFLNGDVYDGGWINDLREGAAEVSMADGATFEGMYAKDKREGQGKLTMANGNVYEGEWKEGRMEGQGKYTFKNKQGEQSVYEGEFKDNKIEGQGKLTNAAGEVSQGTWVEGIMQ